MTAVALETGRRCPGDFDADYLSRQAPDLRGPAAEIYLNHGVARALNPTPWFSTDWYAWQNPDWQGFPTPYDHYLDKGCFEGRDPSPFVDARRFRAMTGAHPAQIYGLIRAGMRNPALGVYRNRRDLEDCQAAFRSAIQLVAHRITPPAQTRPGLVVLQAGRGLPDVPWQDDHARDWDLMVNYYDAHGYQPALGEYVLFQKGTKFTAMWNIWRHFPALLDRYDHVLFLDDDVEATVPDLNLMFHLVRVHGLDLAQMSLTEDSSCNWTALFSRGGQEAPRGVSAVEIMMPVFSRRALQIVAPTFAQSVSGFGLDLAWGKLVAEAGGKIAVLDQVAATHARPVDQATGAYYSYMRRHMINPKAELWALLQDHDADRNLISQ